MSPPTPPTEVTSSTIPSGVYFCVYQEKFLSLHDGECHESFDRTWRPHYLLFPPTREDLIQSQDPAPPGVYYSAENQNFYGALHKGCGTDFYVRWYYRRREFPQSSQRPATLNPPIPPGVYYSNIGGDFYDAEDDASMGLIFYQQWHSRRDEFPARQESAAPQPNSTPPCAAYPHAQILKGTGLYNGDGWKDTTRLGETVYVWCSPLPAPHEPGQYPRVLYPGWSASVHQYAFQPATVEEVRELFDSVSHRPEEPGL